LTNGWSWQNAALQNNRCQLKTWLLSSPYEPAKQTLFYLSKISSNFINIKINPDMSADEALTKIGMIFQKYNPSSIFDYKFADLEYAKKIHQENASARLASVFATLAIFISCLGLFGSLLIWQNKRQRKSVFEK